MVGEGDVVEACADEKGQRDAEMLVLVFTVNVSREEVTEADVKIPPQTPEIGQTVVEEQRRVVGDVGEVHGVGNRSSEAKSSTRRCENAHYFREKT